MSLYGLGVMSVTTLVVNFIKYSKYIDNNVSLKHFLKISALMEIDLPSLIHVYFFYGTYPIKGLYAIKYSERFWMTHSANLKCLHTTK